MFFNGGFVCVFVFRYGGASLDRQMNGMATKRKPIPKYGSILPHRTRVLAHPLTHTHTRAHANKHIHWHRCRCRMVCLCCGKQKPPVQIRGSSEADTLPTHQFHCGCTNMDDFPHSSSSNGKFCQMLRPRYEFSSAAIRWVK